MTIFTHTDDDGDSMEVYAVGDGIEFRTATATGGAHSSACRVPNEQMLTLYAALGEWLYPVHTPEAPNRSLIEQLIDKAAKDAVTAILPHHLRPAYADRRGYVDATPNPYATQSSPGLCRDCGDTRPSLALYHACTADVPRRCTIEDCPFPTTVPGAAHYEHEPIACSDAGEHRPQECPEATTRGRWEAELRRDAGRSLAVPYCGDCGHSRIRHDSGRCSVRGCKCDRDGR